MLSDGVSLTRSLTTVLIAEGQWTFADQDL